MFGPIHLLVLWRCCRRTLRRRRSLLSGPDMSHRIALRGCDVLRQRVLAGAQYQRHVVRLRWWLRPQRRVLHGSRLSTASFDEWIVPIDKLCNQSSLFGFLRYDGSPWWLDVVRLLLCRSILIGGFLRVIGFRLSCKLHTPSQSVGLRRHHLSRRIGRRDEQRTGLVAQPLQFGFFRMSEYLSLRLFLLVLRGRGWCGSSCRMRSKRSESLR